MHPLHKNILIYEIDAYTMQTYLLFPDAVSPYLLFTRYSSYIRRVYPDGAQPVRTVYTGGYPRGLDFDYRYGIIGLRD